MAIQGFRDYMSLHIVRHAWIECIILVQAITLGLSVPSAVSAQRKQSFDAGWRFHRGEAINAETVNYDDSKWREVIVPHDFSMEPSAYVHDYRMQTAVWSNWQVGPFSRHIAVAGTGHPYDVRSFRSLTPTTFRGMALLIIQPQEDKGVVNITVSSPKFSSSGTFRVVMR